MEGLISTFHIDTKIIIAQMVNFAIVFFVLYVYALKPLSKLMQKRRAEIEKGITDAKRSEEILLSSKEKGREELKKAKAEANRIIIEAKQKAEDILQKAEEEAKQKAEEFLREAHISLEGEKREIEKEIKEKTAHLVSLAVQKILLEDLDEEREEQIIRRSIAFFKEQQ